jgi:hypothetical protein
MLAGVVSVLCSVRAALTTTAGISFAIGSTSACTGKAKLTDMTITPNGKNLFKRSSNEIWRQQGKRDLQNRMRHTMPPAATYVLLTAGRSPGLWCAPVLTPINSPIKNVDTRTIPFPRTSSQWLNNSHQSPLRGQRWDYLILSRRTVQMHQLPDYLPSKNILIAAPDVENSKNNHILHQK